MDDVYSKIKNYFTTNNIIYREIKHDPGASAEDYHKALGCRYEQQLKSLLLKIYENGKEYFVVLTIPAQKRADFETIKTAMNAIKVRMATQEELKVNTGCSYGELPPLGKIFNLQLIMDKDFLIEQETFMNAGKVDISFVVNPLDLQKLENPILI